MSVREVGTFLRMCVSNVPFTLGLSLVFKSTLRDWLLFAHKSRDLRVMLSFKTIGFLVSFYFCTKNTICLKK